MAWIEKVREKIKAMNEVTCEIFDTVDDSKYIDFKAKELEYKSLKYMKSKGRKVLKVTSPLAQDVDKLKGWVFKSDTERRELLRLYLCQKISDDEILSAMLESIFSRKDLPSRVVMSEDDSSIIEIKQMIITEKNTLRFKKLEKADLLKE